MEDDNISKDLLSSIWVLSLVMCLILNFNFMGALIFNGWKWIANNWMSDILPYILIPYYLLVHAVVIFGFKSAVTRLN